MGEVHEDKATDEDYKLYPQVVHGDIDVAFDYWTDEDNKGSI